MYNIDIELDVKPSVELEKAVAKELNKKETIEEEKVIAKILANEMSNENS